ncbi:hypothetical protein JXA88_00775 [Candidatus Fermentibacteria bacterium]|nr:hypothetical protein [Candidatus Fermentibacteria bacterium]
MAKRIAALLLALAIGCSRDRSADARFVDFYADVVHAQGTAFDSVTAVDSALAVAARHGVTEQELAAFRERMARSPEQWVDVWERMQARLRELETASKPNGDPAAPSPGAIP